MSNVYERIYAQPYLETGITYLRQNQFMLAISNFNMALSYWPDDPYARWNRAMALLSVGDYETGFAEFEWGWRLYDWRKYNHKLLSLPMWDGAPGKKVLLYHELGHGDAIMCFRYLWMLRLEAESITLLIDEPLARLARQFNGVDVITDAPEDLTAFDVKLPFFSAMIILRQTVQNIPGDPYIKASWNRTGGKVGIAWSGRTQTMFTGSMFVSMLDCCENYDLYSLQPGQAPPGVMPLPAGDFADTAARIEYMDHVISVDTAVAHLAGAMGHPSTHVVLPFQGDWRWWRTEAWYPTLKAYRQPSPENWVEPFARVNEAISSGEQSDSKSS